MIAKLLYVSKQEKFQKKSLHCKRTAEDDGMQQMQNMN